MRNEHLDKLRGEWEEALRDVEAIDAEIDVLRSEDAEISAELVDRHDQALTAAEKARDAYTEYEARLARIAAVRDVPEAVESEESTMATKGVNINTRSDVFDVDSLRHESDADVRSRAETAVERHVPAFMGDEVREAATAMLARPSTRSFDSRAVASHIVNTTDPAYVDAFREYIADPMAGVPERLKSRAAMSLTAANGGVLVPQFLDPTIVLTNAGTNNEVRQIAGQVSITVDQWDGVTSAGVTAEWLAEGSEAADATPTFVGPTIGVHKAAAYVFGSYEMLSDSGFDEIGVLIADAKDRLEATAFTTGNASNKPAGLIHRLSGTGPVVAGSSGAAGAADLVAADIYALDEALSPRWRGNASWLSSRAIYNDIRGLTDTRTNFWASFGGGVPAELIGYPTYHADEMDSAVVSGSDDYVLLLGDFRAGYKIVDRVGTSIAYDPLVIGANQRPTGQAGWFAFWRVGGDVITSNAFKLLKI